MYLSKLVLNPRSRQVRRELAEPYQMHRTLMRAFPAQGLGDADRMLFRVDISRETGIPSVLVQSECLPDWAPLQRARDYLLELFPPKEFQPTFVAGQRLVFRLRANPTVKRDGKRLGLLREEEQENWLRRKGQEGGFQVLGVRLTPEGLLRGTKHGQDSSHALTHLAVRFDGVLQVIAPDQFVEKTLRAGIGSGKGFGFGLLSVAQAE
jgi:CRISPR system Cascade subunit CasE